MSRSSFLLLSAWAKVQIFFAGHVWIGRVHTHDDVSRHLVCGLVALPDWNIAVVWILYVVSDLCLLLRDYRNGKEP